MYHVTVRCIYATAVAVEKEYYTFQKCVFVALGNQHATRMCHTVICDLSTLSHEWHNGEGWILLNIKCVIGFSLQILSAIFLILRVNE